MLESTRRKKCKKAAQRIFLSLDNRGPHKGSAGSDAVLGSCFPCSFIWARPASWDPACAGAPIVCWNADRKLTHRSEHQATGVERLQLPTLVMFRCNG